jgi:uncharacterized SAM-binding protein YcdF (DUF218 family)
VYFGLFFFILSFAFLLFDREADFLFLAFAAASALCFTAFVLKRAARYSAASKLAGIALIVMKAGLCAVGLLVMIAGIFIIGASRTPETSSADYLIILGAPLDKGEISTVLRSRIDAAAEYLTDNADSVAILSGTGNDGEPTQAATMRDALIKEGIAESRMLLDETSINTLHNLKNSFAIIHSRESGTVSVAVLTNRFHVFRTREVLKYIGETAEVIGVDAPRPMIALNYGFRECFALMKFCLVALFIPA